MSRGGRRLGRGREGDFGNFEGGTHHLGRGGDDWAGGEDGFGNFEGGTHHVGRGGEEINSVTLVIPRAAITTWAGGGRRLW